MDQRVLDIDWASLPESIRVEKWAGLTDKERALAWKISNHDERQAIADITSIDLNELSARARQLPENLEEREPGSEEFRRRDKKDNIKFELERIHRERVETELEAIRKSFSNYAESNEERSRKRRAENIYILVALGIIGGYLSYNSNLVLETIYQQIGLAFTVASAVFILIKVITVRISDIPDETVGNRLDDIVDVAFAAVITGVFVFGSIGAIVTIFDVQSKFLGNGVAVIITGITMLAQLFRLQGSYINDQTKTTDEIYDDLIEKLFRLPESSSIEEDSEEIVEHVRKLSEAGAITPKIEDIKDKVSKIEGIPDRNKNYILQEIEAIIEENKKREKSEEELRGERIADLEEQREEYYEKIREEEG